MTTEAARAALARGNAADLDRAADLDALSVSCGDDQLARYPSLGTRLFADGFDADADTACWSTATP